MIEQIKWMKKLSIRSNNLIASWKIHLILFPMALVNRLTDLEPKEKPSCMWITFSQGWSSPEIYSESQNMPQTENSEATRYQRMREKLQNLQVPEATWSWQSVATPIRASPQRNACGISRDNLLQLCHQGHQHLGPHALVYIYNVGWGGEGQIIHPNQVYTYFSLLSSRKRLPAWHCFFVP